MALLQLGQATGALFNGFRVHRCRFPTSLFLLRCKSQILPFSIQCLWRPSSVSNYQTCTILRDYLTGTMAITASTPISSQILAYDRHSKLTSSCSCLVAPPHDASRDDPPSPPPQPPPSPAGWNRLISTGSLAPLQI